MLIYLTYISIIAGGLLILLMLLSLIGGLDLDLDIGDTDVETDAGGLGLIKGALTFVSVTSWVMKTIIVTQESVWLAGAIGIIAGLVAVWLLSYFFRFLLQNQQNVNWEMSDAVYQEGKVYLRIPAGGSGIVHVTVKGAVRELKAKTRGERDIPTGDTVLITDTEGEYVITEPVKRNDF